MSFPSPTSGVRMPCPRCGEAVARLAADEHRCDPQRRLEFQMAAMRPRLASFEEDLDGFLAGNEGRFEAWLAERQVRRSA